MFRRVIISCAGTPSVRTPVRLKQPENRWTGRDFIKFGMGMFHEELSSHFNCRLGRTCFSEDFPLCPTCISVRSSLHTYIPEGKRDEQKL
jgi:hypothetical protein